ncbi:MAG: hypothetical protein H8E62_09810 [Planctomycetes bacterium]|nr:hypothetical protein [Planctomycetota bacterium]
MSINLTESSPGFYIDADYQSLLAQMGLDSVAAVFGFRQGQNLVKSNLASWRHRIRFQLPNGQYAYLKRYDHPPKAVQIKAWFQHGQRAFLSGFDKGPMDILQQVDVSIPKTIACGGQWQGFFEKQSFIITLELENARSLEKKLPDCFHSDSPDSHKDRKECITQLADFIRRFHQTGYRHRDLYLAHIFLSDKDTLSLIDLHRCFRPYYLKQRYQIKDLAQLHYSCPGETISLADRIRFYREYLKADKLTAVDKARLRKIHTKALRIARHDRKHGRVVPFETNAH